MEEKKEKKWMMPEDIKVIETNKAEEMLHKYLAESAVKTWTENFVDQDMGEKVPVERHEVIFDRGTYIDESVFPKIMFSIQSEELKTVIVEKGTEPFHLTYSDDQNLYISIGYGQQKTGGYSIAVDELYLTEDAIYVGTTLLGPEITGQKKGAEKASTPSIVIKTEFLDKTVIYE